MSGRRTSSSGRSARPKLKGPIIIVDDNLDDAALTKRAILSLNPDIPVRLFESGKALIAFLESENGLSHEAPHQIASAILLDLRMPEMDGFEVMEWIKKHSRYADIPIIVLSVFDDLTHLRRAYALLARAYLLKPIDAGSFRNALSSLNIDF